MPKLTHIISGLPADKFGGSKKAAYSAADAKRIADAAKAAGHEVSVKKV